MVNLGDAVETWCFLLVPSVDAVPITDYLITGGVITEWNAAKLGTQPTGVQLSSITQAQVDDYYRSKAKASATIAIDLNPGYDKRAIANVLVNEINSLRDWITSFKAAVAAASSLANLQTRVAALPDMPDRTLAQAKTAYKSLLAGTTLDE